MKGGVKYVSTSELRVDHQLHTNASAFDSPYTVKSFDSIETGFFHGKAADAKCIAAFLIGVAHYSSKLREGLYLSSYSESYSRSHGEHCIPKWITLNNRD